MTNRSYAFIVVALSFFVSFLFAPAVFAGTAGPLSGYAWSDTIGWISFNCSDLGTCGTSNYGISVSGTGALSGYAWSENVGWISANSADLTGCPTAPCTAAMSGGSLTGWMRVLSAPSGGWDGFIRLNGVSYSGTTFSGYAWGDAVVGWVDFSTVRSGYDENPPACSVTFDTNPIAQNSGTTIRWSSSNASSFYIASIGYVTPNSAGSAWVQPNSTTDYSGSAAGTFGTVSCPAVLTVSCTANSSYTCTGADGQTITRTDTNAACQQTTTTVTTCSSPSFCSAGSSTCLLPPITYVPNGSLTGHLQARPQLTKSGTATQLYWNVTNVRSCQVTGTNGDRWNAATSGASGVTTSMIVSKTTYTLSCLSYGGTTQTETAVVNVTPGFIEK